MALVSVFISVVLPVFLIAATGAAVHRIRPLTVGPLSAVILYAFSPALVFHSLATTTVPAGEMGRIAVFSSALLVALYVLAMPLARALRLDGPGSATFVVSALFMNAGNYGLPVAMFAFGPAGLSVAVIFFVIQAILGWTVGVFLASRSHAGIRTALRSVLTLPTAYAAILGSLVGGFGLAPPEPVLRASEVLGAAAVPTMLVVLGVQVLSNGAFTDLKAIAASAVIRLVASSMVAAGLVQILGIEGVTAQVLIVVAGMPTAVFTTILATEFGGRPALAGSAVVVSTLASVVTVTATLALVGVV
ncbi:MAG: AEC family transporter [Chloroflexi bacterium]|nr:AEC family transporter [Chloroflexota bacterium]